MFRYKTFSSIPRFQYLRQLTAGSATVPIILALVMLSLLLLSAPGNASEAGDPLEPVNRATLRFNRVVDSLLFKPVARTYSVVMPEFAKQGVHNFFSNAGDVTVVVNDLLQFKFRQAGSDLSRVVVNSTLGVGGLFNVAGNALGLKKHDEDFGQTLAAWGVGSGPYLVLPLLGPSTVRDAFGLATDSLTDPIVALNHEPTRNDLLAGESLDFRARVLHFDDLISGDEYLFIRSAWQQHREFQVSDGRQELAFESF